MTWLVKLFTTFHGRISRKDWWIGIVIIVAVALIGQWVMAPSSLELSDDPDARPSPVEALWSAILFLPTLAITLKRLNDRDQPRPLGYAFAVVYLVSTALFQFLPADWTHFGTLEWALTLPLLLFSCWVFIDNAFLKGSEGPNRYGADPLDPGSGGTTRGAVPATGRGRYSRGAFLRDAWVGMWALIASIYLFVPNVTLEKTVIWALSLYIGSDYEEMNEIVLGAKHTEQLDPEGEKEETELGEQMQANAKAWEDYRNGLSARVDDRYEEAVRDFTLAIDRYGAENKVSAKVFLLRGTVYRETKQPVKALKDYNIVIALRPRWTDGYTARGRLYEQQKQYRKALADYDQAIRISPAPEPLFEKRRGDLFLKLEEPQEALDAYEKSIQQAKQRYAHLVEINRGMPDLTEEERETFHRWAAKRRDRSFRRAELGRGEAFRDLGRLDDALAAFDQAIELDPDAAYGYIQRGWTFEKMGQLVLAMANYERARELGSKSNWLKKAIARVAPKVK